MLSAPTVEIRGREQSGGGESGSERGSAETHCHFGSAVKPTSNMLQHMLKQDKVFLRNKYFGLQDLF